MLLAFTVESRGPSTLALPFGVSARANEGAVPLRVAPGVIDRRDQQP